MSGLICRRCGYKATTDCDLEVHFDLYHLGDDVASLQNPPEATSNLGSGAPNPSTTADENDVDMPFMDVSFDEILNESLQLLDELDSLVEPDIALDEQTAAKKNQEVIENGDTSTDDVMVLPSGSNPPTEAISGVRTQDDDGSQGTDQSSKSANKGSEKYMSVSKAAVTSEKIKMCTEVNQGPML